MAKISARACDRIILVKIVSWLIILFFVGVLGAFVFTRLKNSPLFKKLNDNGPVNLDKSMEMTQDNLGTIELPLPKKTGELSIEKAISGRRSHREFSSESLTTAQISQILWAAQGVTNEAKGYRAAPSAGALHPLELYLVVKDGGASDMEPGVYHYLPAEHSIEKILEEDVTSDLDAAALGQSFIGDAPVSLVITAEYARVTGKYGERGRRYVHMEAGHAAQNVYLQAESLKLATVTVGAFDDEKIVNILQIPVSHEPLYIMPIGNPK